jgi:hypothetical protein
MRVFFTCGIYPKDRHDDMDGKGIEMYEPQWLALDYDQGGVG